VCQPSKAHDHRILHLSRHARFARTVSVSPSPPSITSNNLFSAVNADVTLLNEIGLDPGIDHCSAYALLERVRARGMRVRSFISFCGGLPESRERGAPLGYKFSWSPRGAIAAALNGARFRLDDQVSQFFFPLLLFE